MFITSTGLFAACGVMVMVLGLGAGSAIGADTEPASAAAMDVVITPRGADVSAAFAALRRNGWPSVRWFGGARPGIVSCSLRFTSVAGRTLIEAVTNARALKVAWVHDGHGTVLYRGCAEAEIDRVCADLASALVAVRREAAALSRCIPNESTDDKNDNGRSTEQR